VMIEKLIEILTRLNVYEEKKNQRTPPQIKEENTEKRR
jgi:hypothetical protein